MNTRSILTFTATVLLSTIAGHAAHNPAHQPQPRNPREGGQPHEQSRFIRMASYPFRAAQTIVSTPIFVGETFAGKRTFISKRGLFMKKETPEEAKSREMRNQSLRDQR